MTDNLNQLIEQYRSELFDNVLPFWLENSIDKECGGYFTCLDREGKVFDTDKFIWLQGREVWMLSMLYNNVEKNPEWLAAAEQGAQFLKNHGHDGNYNFYFSTTRDGKPLVEPYNIFSNTFATMAFGQLAKATGKKEYEENAVLYYGPTIFEDAGLSGSDSLFYQVMVGLVNTLTTVAAMLIIDKIGRKQLVYWGVSGMIISLLLISAYFTWGDSLGLPPVLLLTFFLLYIMCCAGSICAVVFVILSEMYPTKVRAMAMSIAGLALWVGTYLVGQLTPWLLANLTAVGTFLLFAAMCVPYLIIMYRCVPETTGRTLEEIEKYWEEDPATAAAVASDSGDSF